MKINPGDILVIAGVLYALLIIAFVWTDLMPSVP